MASQAGWRPDNSGTRRRLLGGHERFMIAVSSYATETGREHWSLSATARFSTKATDVEARLRNAWVALRQSHPDIASYKDDEFKIFDPPDPSVHKAWLAKAFVVDRAQTKPEALITSFQRHDRATLYYLPKMSTVVLHAGHWMIDGRGIIQLLGKLFEHLSHGRGAAYDQMSLSEEHGRLLPALERLTGIESDPSADPGLKALATTVLTSPPSVGLRCDHDKASRAPESGTSHTITFDEPTTQALVEACRAKGISITSAIHAANAGAHFDDDPSSDVYGTLLPVDVRSHLVESAATSDTAAIECATAVPLVATRDSSFVGIAADARAACQVVKTREFLATLDERANQLSTIITSPPPAGSRPQTQACMSSLGVVDGFCAPKYQGLAAAVEVHELGVHIEMLTHLLQQMVWTFCGRMSIAFCYNSAYYEQDYIRNFAEVVEEGLKNGLNV